MTRWTKLPLRLRLTLVFAAGTALTLGAVSVFVYVRTAADLLDTVDAGLRSRAAILVVDVRARGPGSVDVGTGLIERDEAFAQITDGSGGVVRSNEIVQEAPMLSPSALGALTGPTFFDRSIPRIDNVSRILAVPVQTSSGRAYVVVGTSLQDRADQLLQLAVTLGIGTPIALLLLSLAGWWLARAALAPVERMRREAASISSTDPRVRLSLPPADDEITRLGATMNEMLDRIQASVEAERRFVDDASHELRTPLSILKAELDLALAHERSPEELRSAVHSAAEETDRLVRLAEDLLVLARGRDGSLPMRGVATDLRSLLGDITGRHRLRATGAQVSLEFDAPQVTVRVDDVRVRQALDDLLDNAVRVTPPGGAISIVGSAHGGSIRIAVTDSGPGFSDDVMSRAFEPFVSGPTTGDGIPSGSGLGLSIVRTIAEAHGGGVTAENLSDGGARVTIMVRDLG